MDKGKLGRMMRKGKYEVLKVKWTEEEEEERFKLLPDDPPSSEAPPRPPLMGGGGRLRRFAKGLIEMIRTAAASVAGSVTGRPDVIPVDVIPADVIPANVIGPANEAEMPKMMMINFDEGPANEADDAKDDDDDFDEAKCVVGAGRTYCRNCCRYHHALVPQI